MRRLALLATVLSGLSGCSAFSAAGSSASPGPDVTVRAVVKDRGVKLRKVCLRGVALHSTFDKRPAEYREIALLTASGDWDAVSNSELYQELRRETGRLGANAVIVESLDEASTLGKLIEIQTGWITQRRSSATAIYVPADSQRVRLACAAKK